MDFNSSEEAVSWFRDRYREGTLKIKPPYQRKPVWTARQKCYLVESILLGLPVPEIYVQQATTAEGEVTYAIVDGQQRIRTILQFIGAETDPSEQEYNKFILDKLPTTSTWQNKAFADLSPDDKKRFYGHRFAVRYLNTSDDEAVRDMFRRLNKFLTPLNAQELRNATYTGPFVTLARDLADSEYWAENRLVTPALIRRMRDVEFISELLISVLHGPQGGSAKVVDQYYQQYEDYDDEFPGQTKAKKLFGETLQTIQQVLPNIKQTRWSNKTDFYTLFTGIASLLRTSRLPSAKVLLVRKALEKLAAEVDSRLADENARVSEQAIRYVRAVEKGANDKKRRADRHEVLVGMIKEYFQKKPSAR